MVNLIRDRTAAIDEAIAKAQREADLIRKYFEGIANAAIGGRIDVSSEYGIDLEVLDPSIIRPKTPNGFPDSGDIDDEDD